MVSQTFFFLVALFPLLVTSSPALHKRVDLSVPPTWRKPDTNLLHTHRNNIANGAISRILAFGGPKQNIGNLGYWMTAGVWSSMAMKDIDAQTNDWKTQVLSALEDTLNVYPNFQGSDWNDDTMWWTTAAMYAYTAYGKNATVLGWVESSWDAIYPYQIQGTSGNGRDFSWPANCKGKSTQGGLFWKNTTSDDNVNAVTTGLFMNLSARLYEVTRNPKYLQPAEDAYRFIKNQIYQANTDLVDDTLHVKDCSYASLTLTYNSGKYIEGLAVLGTATGDQQYIDAAVITAAAAMKTAPWQGSDGIITEGQEAPVDSNYDDRTFKSIYVRGLAELSRRAAPQNSDLGNLIRAYVDTQANALIDLASDTGTAVNPTTYGVEWHGPFDGAYSWGQLAALEVFNSFVMVNPL